MILTRFYHWYERQIEKSLLISAIILYLQIPHSLWAFQCIYGEGFMHHNIATDFLLYGIDTLELIPIIGVTSSLIILIRKKRVK